MDCPLLKLSKKSRKKTMKATWDDSNESASDEEVANFCFMAHSDKKDEENEVILESPSYENYLKFLRRCNLI